MLQVEYNSEDLSGQFVCPFCGQMVKLVGNVHTFRSSGSGVERTYPDAKNSIHDHFNHNKGSFVEECKSIGKVGDTTWQAVEKQAPTRVVAHGRIVVEIGPNSRGPIHVIQDGPK